MIFHSPPPDFDPAFDVVSCFLEHKNQFVLLHRCDHKPQGNTWGVPAGKVGKDETLHESMCRELQEETGIMQTPENLSAEHTVYVRFDNYDFTYHIFRSALSAKPDIQISAEEHKAFRWVTPQEALKMPLIQDEDACIKLTYSL